MGYKSKTKEQLITELKELKEFQQSRIDDDELHRQREIQYQELVKHSRNGVAMFEVIDNNVFILKDINPSGEKIAGLKKEESVDKDILETYPGIKAEMVLYEEMQKVWETGELKQFPVKITTQEGQLRSWVDCCVYKIFDKNVVVIFNDVTEHKRTEEKLERSMKKLEKFARGVVHDLKNPMIAIQGFAVRMIRKCEKNQSMCGGLDDAQSINKIADGISDSIDELRDYIQIKGRKLVIQEINLEQLFKEIYAIFATEIERRGIKWKTEFEISHIKADKSSVRRIFSNLIDNCLKYGGDHLTEIVIRCIQNRKNVLSVYDNGVGVRKEELKVIFEDEKRGESSEDLPGTGIGLAIVKDLVDMHDGSVWAEKPKDRGLTVFLSIDKNL
jgi:PAS domain S-box-containing protein